MSSSGLDEGLELAEALLDLRDAHARVGEAQVILVLAVERGAEVEPGAERHAGALEHELAEALVAVAAGELHGAGDIGVHVERRLRRQAVDARRVVEGGEGGVAALTGDQAAPREMMATLK